LEGLSQAFPQFFGLQPFFEALALANSREGAASRGVMPDDSEEWSSCTALPNASLAKAARSAKWTSILQCNDPDDQDEMLYAVT
jgi:hypothetical protein